ncbi:MAG: glycine cleavage system aminomethyltransferase GcvT [Steroidobacteraceae bacterium]
MHAFHAAHQAKMLPFAGWLMPIHYPLGVLGEHRHTRSSAGLFDVSHMGQIRVRSRSGDPLDAARALEAIFPADLLDLPAGRQRYSFLTTETGGIVDDCMISNLGSCWYLVVNAARTETDLAYLQTVLSSECRIECLSDRALLAIQGPMASAALERWVPQVSSMRFMDAAEFTVGAMECLITRSGYTGEDGFEISLPVAGALDFAQRLVDLPGVELAGLGARDSLRLEAGLCLYGQELSEATTPVEAALEWTIPPVRRTGGSRAAGFPGAQVMMAQLAHGPMHRRVGLRPAERPVRGGALLFADGAAPAPLGRVTSGSFGPSAQHPVAMGYVPAAYARPGTALFAEVRGQRTPVTVCALPFVAHRYHR